MKLLLVIDMQNDFIDGALGTPEAVAIVPAAAEKIRTWVGVLAATMDTHGPDYLSTREGRSLPVVHCVRGTEGWQLRPEIAEALGDAPIFEKPAFGSVALAEYLRTLPDLEEVQLVGLCTDICVVSNALLLRAFLPETPISVDAACCAGVTPQRHAAALETMAACQIRIE